MELMVKFCNRSSRGVTFTELLVAILVLAIVATFVALSLPTSAGMSNKTNEMESATAVAQKYIEAVKSEYNVNPQLFSTVEEGENSPIDMEDFFSDFTGEGNYKIIPEVSMEESDYGEYLNNDGTTSLQPARFTLKVTVAPIKNGVVLSGSDQAVRVTAILRRPRQ